jgi:hypothetical protein
MPLRSSGWTINRAVAQESPEAPGTRPRCAFQDLLAAFVYVALATAMTWPLLPWLGTVIPHDLGDPVAFVWVLWWNAQALPLTTAWLNPPIFHPVPGAITFQDSLLGVWPLTTGLQWLGASPLAVQNLLLFLSFPLSAFAAYLLCRHLTGDRRAAFCGGLVFGFALKRIGQLAHINILLIFWIPLLLLALHRYLETRRRRWLAMAAACWALQGLTSGYFLFYSALLVGLWALYFVGREWRVQLRLALAFALALLALVPWLALYRSVQQMYDFGERGQQAEYYSADVVSLLRGAAAAGDLGRAPPPHHVRRPPLPGRHPGGAGVARPRARRAPAALSDLSNLSRPARSRRAVRRSGCGGGVESRGHARARPAHHGDERLQATELGVACPPGGAVREPARPRARRAPLDSGLLRPRRPGDVAPGPRPDRETRG